MPTPPIPQPLRAAAGLAAVAIDSARKLPEQVVGFPVLAVSAALQASLKVQQRYAELVARGDQLLGHLRGQDDGPPPWARFDDDAAAGPAAPGAAARAPSAFDEVSEVELVDPLDPLLAADPADPYDADVLGGGDAAEALVDALADAQAEASAEQDAAEELAEAALAEATLADVELAEVELAEVELAEAALADATLADVELAGAALAVAAAQAEAAVDAALADAAVEAALAEAALEADPAGTDSPEHDGYLAAGPPIPGYDEMTFPQLRGRLRTLSAEQLTELIGYERRTADRAPFLTMLENRLATVRSR